MLHDFRLKIENPRWFAVAWIVVTSIFLALLVAGLHIRNSDKVQAALVAQEVILYIQNDDANQAYALGAPAFRKSTTEDNMRLIFDQIGPYFRQARIDLIDSYVPTNTRDGSHISYVYRASKPKSTTYIRIVLEKRDGQWLLYGMRTASKPMAARLE
jgi:hypothetical protein